MKRDGWYKRGGVWCHRYQNEAGRRSEFRGYADKGLSRSAYERRLDEVRRNLYNRKLGIVDTSAEPVQKIAARYIQWGRVQGGKGGRPWSPGQEANSVRYLVGTPGCKGMLARMEVNRLDAITLDRFEAALDAWPRPTTRGKVGGVVKAFLNWCCQRRLLALNPLQGWPGKKLESDDQVRMPTLEEFHRILDAAPTERALAYETAARTGARASEFNAIKVDSVKWERHGIVLPRRPTKAKKEHFFQLSPRFVARLKEHAKYRHPQALLFNLSKGHNDRYFHKDRTAAGVAYETDEGKLTFHSLRHLFETTLGFAATDSATELNMGRHTDMRTRKRYLHAQESAQQQTAENLENILDRHQGATGRLSGNGK